MPKVIITGGTGLIGTKLTSLFEQSGYEVFILSSRKKTDKKNIIYWDYATKDAETNFLKNTDCIIHLAGENIGKKRWTKKQKEKIITSRVNSLMFLKELFKTTGEFPKVLISASATGYYDSKPSSHVFTEDDPPGKDFLSNVCIKWEQAADSFLELGARVVKFRIGVVLTDKGGMLPQLVSLTRLMIGSVAGSGRQIVPWIHIGDLISLMFAAVSGNKFNGVYNAVAPQQVTNKVFMNTLASVLNKRIWLPPVPSWVIKLLFGEMSVIVLKGNRISSKKIINSGYKFQYSVLQHALEELLKNRKK